MKRFKRLKIEEQNYISVAFLAVLFVVVFAGLIRSIISPNDILEYENREASKLDAFTIESYLSGDYQDSVEETISDQVFGADTIKEKYNLAKSSFIQSKLKYISRYDVLPDEDDNREIIIDDTSDIGGSEIAKEQTPVEQEQKEETNTPQEETPITPVTPIQSGEDINVVEPQEETTQVAIEINPEKGEAYSGKYYSVGSGLYMFNDYVVQGLASFKANQPRFDKYIKNYNSLIESYPDINFYLYYIERDSDQNYASGSRAGISEYIKSIVNLPESNVGVEEIRSFEEYKVNNYKSDHHWNYKGSYSGYRDIISMINPDDEPLTPIGEYRIGYTRGSFTKTAATANVTDDLFAYEFDYPEFVYYLNGKPANNYGNQEYNISQAKEGNNNRNVSYANFYGGDIGEISIYNEDGNGALLIFGNSYDNAVVKLLASHFNYTYCIDLRYFTSGTGTTFSFAKFLETHPVTDVVCIGNAYYFLQSPFIISK